MNHVAVSLKLLISVTYELYKFVLNIKPSAFDAQKSVTGPSVVKGFDFFA